MTEPALTGILGAIEAAAGRDAAARFSLRYGGGQFHVPDPDRLRHNHPLLDLGQEVAREVAQQFRGDVVYVPLARRVVCAYLLSTGNSIDDVADALGVPRATILRYRRAFSKDMSL